MFVVIWVDRMTTIILFRCHRAYDVCIQALAQLRKLNPHIPIHGLYGGDDALTAIPHSLTDMLVSNWLMPLDDPYYKWKNGDLCARLWFKEHGTHIPFEHAYFLEWDMLFLKPLNDVYGHLEQDTNYGTTFGNFDHIAKTRWYWMREQYGVETDKLMEHLDTLGKPVDMKTLSFDILGGTVFCRAFLQRYSAQPIPSYTNDEVRLSFYSEAFGIPLKNNGIKDKSNQGRNIYLSDNEVLGEKDVDYVLQQGGAVIHPLRVVIENMDEKISS